MDEQETFLALKEILPQLQNRLRQNLQLEFQQQLHQAQLFYKRYAEEMINKREQQLKNDMQRRQTHLRRELSLIQRQRQQWLTLEQNYRQSIFELTSKLQQTNSGQQGEQISALTQINITDNQIIQNNFYKPNNERVSKWNKNNKVHMNRKKSIDVSQHQESFSISKLRKNVNAIPLQNFVYNEVQQKSYREGVQMNNRAYKISNKHNGNQYDIHDRTRRQDTMVLSPPKLYERQQTKISLPQPPSLNNSKTSIFFNGQGKKKLLQMIRTIK